MSKLPQVHEVPHENVETEKVSRCIFPLDRL